MLDRDEQRIFALEARTTCTYIKTFMLNEDGKYRRIASKDMMARLINASRGRISWIDLVLWFYPEVLQEPPQYLVDKAHDRNKITGDQDQLTENEKVSSPSHASPDAGPRDQSKPNEDYYGL